MALTYTSSNLTFPTYTTTIASGAAGVAGTVAMGPMSTTSTSANVVDALVQLSVAAQAIATASATTGVYVYVMGSNDSTSWPDGFTPGATAATTISANGTQLRFLGYLPQTTTSAQTLRSQPMSIAAAFGGAMPRYWALVINNQTSVALPASGSFAGVVTEVAY